MPHCGNANKSRMKKNHIIPALLCAIALAGCSRKVEQPGNLLTFDVAVEAEDLPMSKAMGQIGDVSGIHSGIGVFACNSGHWTYDIPKYWPEDYVSSFAPGKKIALVAILTGD